MASELVACPECKRTLRVPPDLLGKLVKCPTCGQTFTADPTTLAPPPPPPAAEPKPARTSKVSRDKDEEEDEERTRRRRLRRSREEEEEDEDRRRRRRSRSRREDDDDDDDDDDRPRRRYMAPHRGETVLILGILSFFILPIILGPMAWIMGNNDLAQMRSGRMDPAGLSSTNAGRVCGMIATLLCLVALPVLCCLWVAIFSAAGAAAGGAR